MTSSSCGNGRCQHVLHGDTAVGSRSKHLFRNQRTRNMAEARHIAVQTVSSHAFISTFWSLTREKFFVVSTFLQNPLARCGVGGKGVLLKWRGHCYYVPPPKHYEQQVEDEAVRCACVCVLKPSSFAPHLRCDLERSGSVYDVLLQRCFNCRGYM